MKLSVRFTASATRKISLYKNGVNYRDIFEANGNPLTATYISSEGEFSSGDKLAIVLNNSGATLLTVAGQHYLNIVEQWSTEHVVTPAISSTEHVYYDGYLAISASKIRLKTERLNTADKLLSVDNATFTKFTALKDCSIVASVSGARSGGASEIRVEVYDSTNTLIVHSEDRSTASLQQSATSLEYKLSTGDYVVFGTSDIMVDSQRTKFSIKAQPIETTFLAAIPVVSTRTFTPVIQGIGTQTLPFAVYYLNGDRMVVQGYVRCGISTAVTLFLEMPPGITIDHSKVSGARLILGQWLNIVTATDHNNTGASGAIFGDGVNNRIFFSTSPTNSTVLDKAQGITICATNTGLTFNFDIPVLQ